MYRGRALPWGIALRSCALVILLALTWVVVAVALRGASTAFVAAGRTSFATIGLLTIALTKRASSGEPGTGPATRRRPGFVSVAVLAATGVTGYTVLSTTAIEFAGPAVPSLIMTLAPAVLLTMECVSTRTRVRPGRAFATVSAVAGAVLFIMPSLPSRHADGLVLGVILAAGAMTCTVFYTWCFARVNRGFEGPITRRILPIYALGSAPLVVWAASDSWGKPTLSWLSVGILAVLGTVIYVPVYLLQHRLLLDAGPLHTALIGLGVPVVVGLSSPLLGLKAAPTPLQFVVMIAALLSVACAMSSGPPAVQTRRRLRQR